MLCLSVILGVFETGAQVTRELTTSAWHFRQPFPTTRFVVNFLLKILISKALKD
jgi:hypothetical protein